MSTLHEETKQMIRAYANLAIGQVHVRTPYMNNRRLGLRGALGVLVGKGTPTEIEEEVVIMALKEHINLNDLTPELATRFLIDHKLGVDCSGYAFHLLETELYARHKKKLSHVIHLPLIKNPFRRIFAKMQCVKNVGVRTLAHAKNSAPVLLKNIQAGDMIVALQIKKDPARHHLLLVTDVVADNYITEIRYTHSPEWTIGGQYGHGVRSGLIRVTNLEKPLLAQIWEEGGMTVEENGTYLEYASAETIDIRRLNCL